LVQSSLPLRKAKDFIGLFMTADDSTKSQCAHSGMKGQVGGFQNPVVCLQAFPSFLPLPLPRLLLTPFFALNPNPTETLVTQAIVLFDDIHFSPISFKVKGMKTAQMFFEDCVVPS